MIYVKYALSPARLVKIKVIIVQNVEETELIYLLAFVLTKNMKIIFQIYALIVGSNATNVQMHQIIVPNVLGTGYHPLPVSVRMVILITLNRKIGKKKIFYLFLSLNNILNEFFFFLILFFL
jgi:hypothetical protein